VTQTDAYHWSPVLVRLAGETIPRLCKSKQDVLDFFRAAGTAAEILDVQQRKLAAGRQSVSKFAMAREILISLNELGDRGLRARRELLRSIVEFDEFATCCWPDDQLSAKGLVADIRRLVDQKDAFTRMRDERDAERALNIARRRQEEARRSAERALRRNLTARLSALFTMADPRRRGTELEKLLNEIFALNGLSIRESFVLRLEDGTSAEQIDGVVELDGRVYLVEVKWWAEPLGVDPISRHLMRLFKRSDVHGLMISASGYTAPAIKDCEDVISQRVLVLGELRELVLLLEGEGDLAAWLREKTRFAQIERKPLAIHRVDF
jgi:hypothetical protein